MYPVFFSLGLELQADCMTLPKLMYSFEGLTLTGCRTTPGEHLDAYLEQTQGGIFDGMPLTNFNQEVTDTFHR